jgi:hypothetical protein
MLILQSASSSTPPAGGSLVYQLLFLVPGYFTYALAMKVGRVRKVPKYDRFDKLMFSLAASGASIAGLNLIYIIVTDKGPVISPSQIPLTTLSAGYVLHIVITVVVGVIIGIFIRARRDEKIKSNHPWIDLHQDTGDTSPRVGILTTSGQILEGDLYRYERSSDSQDLRLQNAEILVKGSESKYNLPDEGSVYIYGQQIEYVWFVSEIEDE